MTKDEALKLALEHFETWSHEDSIFAGEFDKEITAIKEALAQPEPWEKFCDSNCVWTDHHPDCKLAEQEPFAFLHPQKGFYFAKPTKISAPTIVDAEPLPLYTTPPQGIYYTPPQRTWVGLTDEEISELIRATHNTGSFVQAIEAKLKEKNT